MNLTARLSDLTNNRDNNFNLMRLGAAVLVVLSHSFILSYNEPNSTPRVIGYLAVNCFFIMSGFLVCRSLINQKSIGGFYKARFLRIYPALVLAVLFCVFIVGPINTSSDLADYFSNLETYTFLLKNSLLIFNVDYYLPSVFGIHGSERMVNAPIWTLVFEVYLYFFIGVLGLVALKKPDQGTILFNTMIIAFTAVALALHVYNLTQQEFSSKLIENSVRFSALFGIGATFYISRQWIKLSPLILILLLFLLVVSLKLPSINKAVLYPVLAYVLFYIAYIPKGFLLSFNRLGDYSYGVYIFAYPIQQLIAHWHKTISTAELFISSLSISLIFAVLSWHFVESRALKFRSP